MGKFLLYKSNPNNIRKKNLAPPSKKVGKETPNYRKFEVGRYIKEMTS